MRIGWEVLHPLFPIVFLRVVLTAGMTFGVCLIAEAKQSAGADTQHKIEFFPPEQSRTGPPVILSFTGRVYSPASKTATTPDEKFLLAAVKFWIHSRRCSIPTCFQLPGARRDVDIRQLGCVMDHLYWALLAEALRLNPRQIEQRVRATADVTCHALFSDSESEAV
jgi:hypothetical protein